MKNGRLINYRSYNLFKCRIPKPLEGWNPHPDITDAAGHARKSPFRDKPSHHFIPVCFHDIECSVLIKVIVVKSQRMLFAGMVLCIESQVSGHNVQAAVLIKISRRLAVPPTGVIRQTKTICSISECAVAVL